MAAGLHFSSADAAALRSQLQIPTHDASGQRLTPALSCTQRSVLRGPRDLHSKEERFQVGGGSCIPQVPAPRATPTCVAEGGGPSLVPRGKHVLLKVELCGRLS